MELTSKILAAALILISILIEPRAQLTRCVTQAGDPGLCVGARMCRLRTVDPTPCSAGQPDIHCCPFPVNKSSTRTLHEHDYSPIVFPGDQPQVKKDHRGTDEIVFPDDEPVLKELPSLPRYLPKPEDVIPWTSIERDHSKHRTTPKTLFTSTTSPKTSTELRERNPKESASDLDEGRIIYTYPQELTTKGYGKEKSRASSSVIQNYGGRDTFSEITMSPDQRHDYQPSEITSFNKKSDTRSITHEACGQAPYEAFIAGGVESGESQWPWMAAIFQRFMAARRIKFLCGGSLINSRYVLTAGHCCVSGATSLALPASSFMIKMGSNSLNEGDSFSVSEVKVHANFSYSGQFNDIALLRLTSPLTAYTNRITPVCLPPPTINEAGLVDHLATVIGWGSAVLGGDAQERLQEAAIPIVSIEDCALAYSRIKSAAFLARGSTHVLCAGLKEGGKDSCKRDSGGPLMMQLSDDVWTIIGIVSFGYRCAEPGYPGVYTSVTHYIPWIYDNVEGC